MESKDVNFFSGVLAVAMSKKLFRRCNWFKTYFVSFFFKLCQYKSTLFCLSLHLFCFIFTFNRASSLLVL